MSYCLICGTSETNQVRLAAGEVNYYLDYGASETYASPHPFDLRELLLGLPYFRNSPATAIKLEVDELLLGLRYLRN